MGDLFQTWLREPNLTEPGKKPVGDVELVDKSIRAILVHGLNDTDQFGVYDLAHSSGVVDAGLDPKHGRGWTYSGGASGDYTAIPVQGMFDNDFTVFIVFRNNDGITTNKWFFSEGANTRQIAGLINEGGYCRAFWRNDVPVAANIVGSKVPTNDGELHVAAFTGRRGGVIQLFVDGVFEGQASHPGGTFSALATTIGAMRRPTTVELEAAADVYHAEWQFKQLSPDAVIARSRDIYSAFKPTGLNYPLRAPAAAGAANPWYYYAQH
jgi:hypothetical protein